MGRPSRIEYAGALYQVTSRGDRQEAIFDDDQDRSAFLNVLGEVVSRYRWRCHAYRFTATDRELIGIALAQVGPPLRLGADDRLLFAHRLQVVQLEQRHQEPA